MKKFKSVVSFLLVLSLVLISGQTMNVAASGIGDTAELPPNAVYTSSASKQTFVEKAEERYADDLAKGKIKTYSQQRVNTLMENATFATGAEKDRILAELSQYGVYLFNTASSSSSGNMRYDTGNITMTAPSIYYTMSLSTWTITCGGNWTTNNWGQLSDEGLIGGSDAFGVSFTETSGTFNTQVVSAYAFISDQNDENRHPTSYRSDGNGRNGFGFRLQDRQLDENIYVGYRWYGSCIFNANFSSYDGIATAYYIHTYNAAYISSLTLGVSVVDPGYTVVIENREYSFAGYSSDVAF